jgi:hypothetical protein
MQFWAGEVGTQVFQVLQVFCAFHLISMENIRISHVFGRTRIESLHNPVLSCHTALLRVGDVIPL